MKLNRVFSANAPDGMLAATALGSMQEETAVTAARAAWDGAWSRYQEAKRASDDFTRTVFDPAFEKARAIGENIAFDLLQRDEELAEAYGDLELVLLALPAPDLQALSWKLRLGFGEAWNLEVVRAVKADVRRLLGGEC